MKAVIPFEDELPSSCLPSGAKNLPGWHLFSWRVLATAEIQVLRAAGAPAEHQNLRPSTSRSPIQPSTMANLACDTARARRKIGESKFAVARCALDGNVCNGPSTLRGLLRTHKCALSRWGGCRLSGEALPQDSTSLGADNRVERCTFRHTFRFSSQGVMKHFDPHSQYQ